MKTIKTAITLMALAWGLTAAQAEIYDRLVLKNGKVVAGYIAGQQPGQCINFYAEEIVGSSTSTTTIDADELIPIVSTTTTNGQYDDINSISTADGLPRTYSFSISDVSKIERELRPEGQTIGLTDVVTSRTGEVYEGQITGQIMGSSIQIWDGKTTHTIYNNDLASQEKRPLDPSKDILEQTPFLDIVVTQRSSYSGIIVMQSYGDEQQSSYLRIKLTDGTFYRISISDIRELKREPNNLYKPNAGQTDFVPEPGVIYFNRTAVTSIPTEKERNGYIVIDEEDMAKSLILPLENGRLSIVMDDTPDNRNTILLPISQQKIDRKMKYAFNYEDIVDKSVIADSYNTDNAVIHKEFTIKAGTYVLYHRETGMVNFCEFQ